MDDTYRARQPELPRRSPGHGMPPLPPNDPVARAAYDAARKREMAELRERWRHEQAKARLNTLG